MLRAGVKTAPRYVVNSLGVKVLRGVNESCTLGRLWNASGFAVRGESDVYSMGYSWLRLGCTSCCDKSMIA